MVSGVGCREGVFPDANVFFCYRYFSKLAPSQCRVILDTYTDHTTDHQMTEVETVSMPKVGLHVSSFRTAHFFAWTAHFGSTGRLNFLMQLQCYTHDTAEHTITLCTFTTCMIDHHSSFSVPNVMAIFAR